jgi:hypothetical protein
MSKPSQEALLELLEHEAFVQKILEVRKLSGPDGKHFWRYVLESPVIVALVTVILGSIATQIIVARFQEDAKKNEQMLQEHKQLLERQEEIIQRAYGLAGGCISDSQRLISFTQKTNEEESVSEPFKPAVRERRISILSKHYAQLDEWQVEGNKIALLIGHYFNQQSLQSWRQAQDSIDALLDCSDRIYRRYIGDPRAKTTPEAKPCKAEVDAVKVKLDILAASVQSSLGKPKG